MSQLQEKLDSLIPPDPQVKMTLGECIKLMIINGLGFTSRPLYLEAQFFESRPVQRFLGRDCAVEINDDRLGRALDQCYDFGCNRLFAALASRAAIQYGFVIWFKRLEQGTFSWTWGSQATLDRRSFLLLLEGVIPKRIQKRFSLGK